MLPQRARHRRATGSTRSSRSRPTARPSRRGCPRAQYLAIVAATNFKQRTRKMLEYFHADRLNYAVLGTPNRLEYDQGFFVKHGDGAADVKPIAHLYKTQVYALAEHLGVPEEIRARPPTTDTYSLPQTQEEFYFSLPYDQMDLCLYARDHGLAGRARSPSRSGSTAEQVERVFADIDQKRRTTRYLHLRRSSSRRSRRSARGQAARARGRAAPAWQLAAAPPGEAGFMATRSRAVDDAYRQAAARLPRLPGARARPLAQHARGVPDRPAAVRRVPAAPRRRTRSTPATAT